MFTCASTVFRNEGVSAFYVSYPTTLTMTVPFTAAQFTVYEHVKKLMNPRGEYSPLSHIVAGGVAGGVAAGLTTPLDVAKTLLQTRGTSTDPEIRYCRGMLDALRIIWRRDGLRGFSRGLTPRVVTHMPSNALCWLSYEFFSACTILFCRIIADHLPFSLFIKSRPCVNSHDVFCGDDLSFLPLDRYVRGGCYRNTLPILLSSDAGAYNHRNYLERTRPGRLIMWAHFRHDVGFFKFRMPVPKTIFEQIRQIIPPLDGTLHKGQSGMSARLAFHQILTRHRSRRSTWRGH